MNAEMELLLAQAKAGDRDASEQLGEKIDQYLPASCVLDFQGVSFMDSSGIAVVLNTRRRMAELGGTVCLQNVAQQPMKVLTAAGIEKIAKIG